ncbi:hypothetical protein HBI56_073370 [Parastagonospora nodorum]|uniref:Uncharacterized protein n=1 Tax=Phaeosphaeria nodorum (strain SN15 / ATCC MYA-4574 / FGSC 10173) TaxID=321614 RepID=A0A7U2EXG5_PHANO|nr:hypothetical protein HBH56_171590 [Parastagonospora nodorum]QRC94537.1 hypothetical protein JI435_406010 [Parastagonospora nodorum SN15]KAH3928340.1 hypothetical protein HBH54_140150 [Parastagonospora nodorum]KAH3945406.1 hypothetical protein HBH53_145500 [Parastagonospora nodorum]KAH3983678.1 hypothetical protein HBH52_058720 [Parastagonospora nodorum]
MGTTLVYDWYADHSKGVFGLEIMLAKISMGWDGFYKLQRYFLHDIPHIFSCSNSKISNTNTTIVTHFPLNMHIYVRQTVSASRRLPFDFGHTKPPVSQKQHSPSPLHTYQGPRSAELANLDSRNVEKLAKLLPPA